MYPSSSNNNLNLNNFMDNQSQMNMNTPHFNPAAASFNTMRPPANPAVMPGRGGVLMENGTEYLMMPGNDDSRWYLCNICHLPCGDKKSLYYHQYVAHVINQTFYRCPLCGDNFLTNDSLQQHLRERHPNQCLFCHIQFASPTHLTNHILLCHSNSGLMQPTPFR